MLTLTLTFRWECSLPAVLSNSEPFCVCLVWCMKSRFFVSLPSPGEVLRCSWGSVNWGAGRAPRGLGGWGGEVPPSFIPSFLSFPPSLHFPSLSPTLLSVPLSQGLVAADPPRRVPDKLSRLCRGLSPGRAQPQDQPRERRFLATYPTLPLLHPLTP